jgi:hypothetical protein
MSGSAMQRPQGARGREELLWGHPHRVSYAETSMGWSLLVLYHRKCDRAPRGRSSSFCVCRLGTFHQQSRAHSQAPGEADALASLTSALDLTRVQIRTRTGLDLEASLHTLTYAETLLLRYRARIPMIAGSKIPSESTYCSV